MAILPTVYLFKWRVIAPGDEHFFITWKFGWSDSLHPPEGNTKQEFFTEFYHDWLGVRPGASLDQHLAEQVMELYREEGIELIALRYGFWRGEHGGNILEFVFEEGKSYPHIFEDGLTTMFKVFGDKQLLPARFVYNSDVWPRDLGRVMTRAEFFAVYADRHRPPYYIELGNLQDVIDHWCEFGPEPSRIVDLVESPVGV